MNFPIRFTILRFPLLSVCFSWLACFTTYGQQNLDVIPKPATWREGVNILTPSNEYSGYKIIRTDNRNAIEDYTRNWHMGVYPSDDNLHIHSGAKGAVATFTRTGFVGIGLATPHALLHIGGSQANRKIVLFESADNDHQFHGMGIGYMSFRFQIPAADRAYRFFRADNATASTEIFTIMGNGSVGIGVASPPADYKLSVAGKIKAKEIKVTVEGLGDYVFSPAYRLRPLSEVASFIKQNGHLPEVPSATEVARDGLNVGEMENTLLKKVEELTLYLLEQNKQLAEQNQKLEELQKVNEQQALAIEQLTQTQKGKKRAKRSSFN